MVQGSIPESDQKCQGFDSVVRSANLKLQCANSLALFTIALWLLRGSRRTVDVSLWLCGITLFFCLKCYDRKCCALLFPNQHEVLSWKVSHLLLCQCWLNQRWMTDGCIHRVDADQTTENRWASCLALLCRRLWERSERCS